MKIGETLLAARIARWCAAMCVPLVLGAAVSARAQKPRKKENPNANSGAKLYKENCAVCHGNDGKGQGPPPPNSPFTASPPDLTTLSQRHGGKFPAAYVDSVMRNGAPAPDHGPAEMPVWGAIFKAEKQSDEARVTRRINSLIDYLRSIQGK